MSQEQTPFQFIKTVAAMVEQYQVIFHGWVLMDSHYHQRQKRPGVPEVEVLLREVGRA